VAAPGTAGPIGATAGTSGGVGAPGGAGGITRFILPVITWVAAGLFGVQLFLAVAGRRARLAAFRPSDSPVGAPR
jgi:hypothetical protein